MSDPCPTCDAIGPDQSDVVQAMRDLHRAFHDFYRTLTVAFLPMVERMQAAAERERLARKDAYVLLNESVAASLRGER